MCYTSCFQYESIVIDQVTLLVILKTPGLFPSLAPLWGRRRSGGATGTSAIAIGNTIIIMTINTPPGRNQKEPFIHTVAGGFGDDGRTVFVGAQFRRPPTAADNSNASRETHRWHHMVCVTEERHGNNIFRYEALTIQEVVCFFKERFERDVVIL